MAADILHEHVSGEHPTITVNTHSPSPGRRPFAFAALFGSLALLIGISFIAVPLHRYLENEGRNDRELVCRNSIGNALQDAQADLIDALAAGLVIALNNDPTEEIVALVNTERTRVRELGDLRFDAVEICAADPTFRPPPNQP